MSTELPPTYPPFSSNPVNPKVSDLATSTNWSASDGGYQIWHGHMQSLLGFWKRIWEYDSSPISVNGIVSGGPLVAFTYVDIRVEEKVQQWIEKASYVSGTQLAHQISTGSDSIYGGWGSLGSFATTQPGYIRKIFEVGDGESLCANSWNTRSGYQTGDYNPANDASSLNFPGEFYQSVIMKAVEKCSTFRPDIVKM